MPSEIVLVVMPRAVALVPALFAGGTVLVMLHTIRSNKHGSAMKLFMALGGSIGVFAALAFTYQIARGHPIETSSDGEFAKWGTVVGKVKSAND